MAKIEREKINANEEELINDIKTKHTKQGSMLDAARKIGELRDSGMTSADISRHIGKTAMFVSDCLKLIDNATPKIISHIESGQLSSTIALEMLKDIPASEVEEAVNSVLIQSAIYRSTKHFHHHLY